MNPGPSYRPLLTNAAASISIISCIYSEASKVLYDFAASSSEEPLHSHKSNKLDVA